MAETRFGFPVTVHIVLRRGDEILLLQRANTGYRDGWYSLVAGHVEAGEQLRRAAAREVEEEVGVQVAEGDLIPVGVMHRRSGDQRVDFFLEARSWRGEPENCEPDKCSGFGWFAVDQLPARTIPYIRHALAIEETPFWFSEYGWRKLEQH